jgi:alkyl sulfatase BDS1-like metallo-beta-lactamase superfamily hydrolase
VKGIVREGDVRVGTVRTVAPVGFQALAVSEIGLAGDTMAHCASLKLGNADFTGPTSQEDAGLGKTISVYTIWFGRAVRVR